MLRRAATLAVLAVLGSTACNREKKCTMEDQCPNGDECSWLVSDTDPLCKRKMVKQGYALRCERENLGGAGRIGVFCPAAK